MLKASCRRRAGCRGGGGGACASSAGRRGWGKIWVCSICFANYVKELQAKLHCMKSLFKSCWLKEHKRRGYSLVSRPNIILTKAGRNGMEIQRSLVARLY